LETAQARAERIVVEELRQLGWLETELGHGASTIRERCKIAQRLREETSLSVKPIAERLHSETDKSASFRLLTTMKKQNSINRAQVRLGLGKRESQFERKVKRIEGHSLRA
jgi:hypothetical protein